MRGPYDRRWRRAICVASGPSLSAEQVEQIKQAQRDGWRVFVANRTWEKFTDADILFGSDRPFWNANAAKTAAHFRGERWTSDVNSAKVYGLNYIRIKREYDPKTRLCAGISRDPDYIVHGGHTGHHLLGFAYARGAEAILLVGYDMQHTGGARNADGLLEGGPIHHHGPHDKPLSNPAPSVLAGWAARMAVTARDLAALGVVVVNSSTHTALECFERATLADALERFRETVPT